jgi:hypothetical protein
MPDEIVKPSEKDGTVEVSPDTTETQSAPEKKKAGRLAFADMSTDRQKEYNRQKTQKSRLAAKKASESQTRRYNNPEEIDLKDVPELLQERDITTPCVISAILRFGFATAQLLNLTANKYYWLKGTTDLQARNAGKEPPPPVGEDFPEGELLTRNELFALYEHCAKGRNVAGKELGFETWLVMRLRARTDLWFLCTDIAGKGLVERTHREMVEFFVKKDPRYLSEIVAAKGDYDQEDLKKVLIKMDDHHDRLLLFPRDFYKSTVNVLDLVQWILVLPDITALVITATLPLGKAFLSELSNYFIVRSTVKISNLQALFPEFTGDPGESGVVFRCPAARLGQKEPTVWNSAIDAESTGFHQLLQIIDDGVSQLNSATPEAREKLWNKVILLDELLSRPEGFKTYVGTRYAGGESPDVYGRLLDLNQQPEGGDLKVLIKGAWTVKPDAQQKKITELTEDDVDLLFPFTPDGEPGKGSFKVLRKKLLADERTFRQQKLNEVVSDGEDELTITFSEADLRLRTKPLSFFDTCQTIENIVVVDPSFTTGRYADPSAIVAMRMARREQKPIAIVTDCVLERLKISDLAGKIVESAMRNRPNRILVERAGNWESLADAIRKAALLRNFLMPYIYYKPTTGGGVINAKAKRIKALQNQIENIWFVQSPIWNEPLFQQFAFFDGGPYRRSGQVRKDDGPDAVALGTEWAMPRDAAESERTEAQKAAELAAAEDAKRTAMYSRIFGSETTYRPPEPEYEEESSSSLFRGLGQHLRRK